MSDLEHHIKALHEIREKKREIQDLESETRLKIIELAGTDKQIALGGFELDVTPRTRFKIVDPELVPAFLKSTLPDQQRIDGYFQETGQVPPGVEIQESCVVKVQRFANDSSSNDGATSLDSKSSESQPIESKKSTHTIDFHNPMIFPTGGNDGRTLEHRKCTEGLTCDCCSDATAIVHVSELLPSKRPLATFRYCSQCFVSWVEFQHSGLSFPPEVAEIYRGLTAKSEGIIPVHERFYELNDFEYQVGGSGLCDECGEEESVVSLKGTYYNEDGVESELDQDLCGKCAAKTIYETDERLSAFFSDLDVDAAQDILQSELNVDDYSRDDYSTDDPDRIRNDPDDPFSDYADGSSPFSY